MQGNRLLARLSRTTAPLMLLLGAIPAAAQDAVETAPSEPLPLFKAVCLGGGARLNRRMATPATIDMLPDPARRALGKTVPVTQAEADKAGPVDPVAAPNRMFQIEGGPTYLLVPAADAAPNAPLADSCMVLWQSNAEEDYLAARRIVLPREDSVPLYLRPKSKPNGYLFATSVTGQSRLTLATYGGWIALRSVTDTSSTDPQKGN